MSFAFLILIKGLDYVKLYIKFINIWKTIAWLDHIKLLWNVITLTHCYYEMLLWKCYDEKSFCYLMKFIVPVCVLPVINVIVVWLKIIASILIRRWSIEY